MYLKDNIHWHEGLFLQPHHMQMSQKSIIDGFNASNRYAFSYSTGLIHSKISKEMLEVGQLKFDELQLIMPSGLYVDIEKNAVLNSVDIKDIMEHETRFVDIYLGIPLWGKEKANTYTAYKEDGEVVTLSRIYELCESKFNDENTGEKPKEDSDQKNQCSFFHK